MKKLRQKEVPVGLIIGLVLLVGCAQAVKTDVGKSETAQTQEERIAELIEQLEFKGIDSVLSGDADAEKAEEALIQIGKPAVKQLIAALKSENKSVRRRAISALIKIGDKSSIESLGKLLLCEKDTKVRQLIILGLSLIASDESIASYLIAALQDKDANVRSTAVGVLGRIKAESVIDTLFAMLKDKVAYVRESAVQALRIIGNTSAVKPLIEALNDENERVRESVVFALAWISDKSAIKPLIETLKDEDADVRYSAAAALQKLTDQDFWEDYDQWLEWWEKNKDKFQEKK